MDYKLIAVDLDGTLTNSKKEVSPRNRYALLEAQKKGKKVIITSGRHPIGVYPIAEDLMLAQYGGYIMSFNGGKIIECATGRTIVSRNFPLEYLSDIVSVLSDYNVTVMSWDDKKIYANNKVNDYTYIERDVLKTDMVVVDDFVSAIKFDINKILVAGEPDVLDACQVLLKKRYDGLLDIYKSAPYFLEIMPFGVSKGAMLAQLLPQIGIQREELIAFGDHYNDMTMIGYAGMGVAMENGEDEVKKIAAYICESNDDDGVAKTIEKYVL